MPVARAIITGLLVAGTTFAVPLTAGTAAASPAVPTGHSFYTATQTCSVIRDEGHQQRKRTLTGRATSTSREAASRLAYERVKEQMRPSERVAACRGTTGKA